MPDPLTPAASWQSIRPEITVATCGQVHAPAPCVRHTCAIQVRFRYLPQGTLSIIVNPHTCPHRCACGEEWT